MTVPVNHQAAGLVAQGRVGEALSLLEVAAGRNDPNALQELAVWLLSGTRIRRNLAASRDFFRRAALAGHPEGARAFNAFLANGTGGAADWGAALALLRGRAAADPRAEQEARLIDTMALRADGNPAEVPAGESLSSAPFVQLFPNAFTAVECDFLIEASEPLMQPALTVDPSTGRQVSNPIRTSDAAAFPLMLESPAIHALNRRIAALSDIAVTHGEPLQVLRYRPGQQFRAHSDALPGTTSQRVATVLVYLNDGYEGGETSFPSADLTIRGRRGDALLFRNVRANGRPDERAVHAGLPVTRGVKLVASRWIRAQPLSLDAPL